MLLLQGSPWPPIDWKEHGNQFFINGTAIQLVSPENASAKDHKEATAQTVWDCSIILSKYLEKEKESIRGKTVLELGSGTGLVSISCSRLDASKVFMTDVGAETIDRLQENAIMNKVQDRCKAFELNWFEPKSPCENIDVILMADVVWVLDLIEPLVETLDSLAKPGMLILLAHQVRSTIADNKLWDKLQEKNFTFSKIDFRHAIYQKSNVSIYSLTKK